MNNPRKEGGMLTKQGHAFLRARLVPIDVTGAKRRDFDCVCVCETLRMRNAAAASYTEGQVGMDIIIYIHALTRFSMVCSYSVLICQWAINNAIFGYGGYYSKCNDRERIFWRCIFLRRRQDPFRVVGALEHQVWFVSRACVQRDSFGPFASATLTRITSQDVICANFALYLLHFSICLSP